jgi:ankyrin repeat protein
MIRATVALVCLLSGGMLLASGQKPPSNPSFDYDTARTHEIKPHRGTIPVEGVHPGFNQLHLTLTVSPLGDVTDAKANGNADDLKFWSQLQGEVYHWRFTPFEKDGKPVAASVEEYIDLVPPERLPKTHITPPAIRPDSKVSITLQRTGCMGNCPAYIVTVSTEGIAFDGGFAVVAKGKHADKVDADAVRDLAKKFVAADFYSMDPMYREMATDLPTYMLSISIDGHEMRVEDYNGQEVGMPAVIADLEEDVDTLARTGRWIEGSEGLVGVLQAEKYNFKTFDAQVMLKQALTNGKTATVEELLQAGVPLEPIPSSKPKEPYESVPFEHVGWLTAASRHPEVLELLIAKGAAKNDQEDKDLALASAADAGSIESVRSLIAYGADPNVDLTKLIATESGGGMTMQGPGSGSILISAAESGNPEMVREILRHRPHLEARDHRGQTAMFAAGDWRGTDADGARVECVRLLAEAGANVNARDDNGNTPLHETFLTDVEVELLKLGADVNARNEDGETPIFTVINEDAVPLYIQHGADLTIRNKKGETVFETASRHGPQREEVLRKAIQSLKQP